MIFVWFWICASLSLSSQHGRRGLSANDNSKREKEKLTILSPPSSHFYVSRNYQKTYIKIVSRSPSMFDPYSKNRFKTGRRRSSAFGKNTACVIRMMKWCARYFKNQKILCGRGCGVSAYVMSTLIFFSGLLVCGSCSAEKYFRLSWWDISGSGLSWSIDDSPPLLRPLFFRYFLFLAVLLCYTWRFF